MRVPNLKKLYGAQFKVGIEEGGDKKDPWAALVLCRHGHIYPHGVKMLGAATNGRGSIAKRLAALPCVQVWQDGSDGLNVIFDVADFEIVAAVMRPRTRRRLSAEHKAKLKLFKARSGVDSESAERSQVRGCEPEAA